MMSERAVSQVAPKEKLVECSFSVPWSIRNDAIWIAEHMRRRHLLLGENELAECSSGLCVLMMGLKWTLESRKNISSKVYSDEWLRDASRDFHRSLIVPEYFIEFDSGVLEHFCDSTGTFSSDRATGVIVRYAVAFLHAMCEVGNIDTVVSMHRAIEGDPLWGRALRENRARDAVC